MSLAVKRKIERARKSAKKGEIELARQLLGEALDSDPGNQAANSLLKQITPVPTAGSPATNVDSGAGGKTNSSGKFNQAKAFHAEGKNEEAADLLMELQKDSPQSQDVLNLLGSVLARLGRVEEAVDVYQQVIELAPAFASNHVNKGIVLSMLKRYQEAASCYENALQLEPNSVTALRRFGAILYDQGENSRARECYYKALAEKPDYFEGLAELGAILLKDNENQEALELLQRALDIRQDKFEVFLNAGIAAQRVNKMVLSSQLLAKANELNPRSEQALNSLGTTLIVLRKFDHAVACLESAIAIKNDYGNAYSNLGIAYAKLRKFDQALEAYEKAEQFNPEDASVYLNRGNCLKELGNHEGAKDCYLKALELNPDYADAYNNLGNAYNDIGERDLAITNFEKSLKLRPDYAGAHRNLSLVKRYSEVDSQLEQMLDLVEDPELSTTDRIHLHFALGKAFDDMQDFAKASSHFQQGNELRHQQLGYNRDKERQLFTNLMSSDFAEGIQRGMLHQRNDSEKTTPIFILGMPRSGTTLTEQILSAHSAVVAGGELMYLGETVHDIDDIDVHPDKTKLTTLGDNYLHKLQGVDGEAGFITDKMPSNFRWVGLIIGAMPQAKIIHTARNSSATCWSIYRHFFSTRGNTYAYNLDCLVEYYNWYLELMDYWNELFPERIYNLSYERLTTDQEAETRKLLEFLELPWEAGCLDFHKNKNAVRTASSSQIRQKMYTGSSEAWKSYEEFVKQPFTNLKKNHYV